MADTYLITRKIEIYPYEENHDKRKEVWAYLRQLEKDVILASNSVVNQQWFNECFEERMENFNSYYSKNVEKIKEKHNKKISEIEVMLLNEKDEKKKEKHKLKIQSIHKKLNDELRAERQTEAEKYYSMSKQNTTWRYLSDHFSSLGSYIIDPLNSQLCSYLTKELKEIKKGERSIRNYRKELPIPFRSRAIKRLQENEKDFSFVWINNIVFKTKLGRDKSNNRIILERVIDGSYSLGDSSIQFKKQKLFLNLVVKIPKEERVLKDEISVGVDLGLSIPAYVSLNNGLQREAIGNIKDFTRVRTQLQSRRKNLQKSLKLVPGGNGRNKKLVKLNMFKDKERNFVKTYNHMVSKRVIDFALKHEAAVIKLEFLEGFSKEHKDSFVLRNWSYYELQQMIKYKADKFGIKVVFVDPYHTSQTCHLCGHFEEGQRISQSEFQCKNPRCESKGEIINADYNASKNIAISNQIVSKKEECEYYKKNKEHN